MNNDIFVVVVAGLLRDELLSSEKLIQLLCGPITLIMLRFIFHPKLIEPRS